MVAVMDGIGNWIGQLLMWCIANAPDTAIFILKVAAADLVLFLIGALIYAEFKDRLAWKRYRQESRRYASGAESRWKLRNHPDVQPESAPSPPR
jgi:hypothetical protein